MDTPGNICTHRHGQRSAKLSKQHENYTRRFKQIQRDLDLCRDLSRQSETKDLDRQVDLQTETTGHCTETERKSVVTETKRRKWGRRYEGGASTVSLPDGPLRVIHDFEARSIDHQ